MKRRSAFGEVFERTACACRPKCPLECGAPGGKCQHRPRHKSACKRRVSRGWYIRIRSPRSGEPDWRRRVCPVACAYPGGGGPYGCSAQRCGCGKGKKLALAMLGEQQMKRAREKALNIKEVGRVTMAAFWPTFRPILESRVTEQGAKVNAGMFKIAAKHFGQRVLADIGASDVEDFFTWLKDTKAGRGCSGATCNRYGSLLSTLFKAAVKRGFARENPVAGVERSREDVKAVPFLTAENIARVEAATPPDQRPAVALAFLTGLRRGELAALAVQDVDLHRGVLIVRRSKTGIPREVPLSPRARSVIDGLLAAPRAVPLRGPDPLLPEFSPDLVSRRFGDWAVAAGVPRLSFHGCRHVFASSLVRSGVPIPTVAALLGHGSPAMVLTRYGRHAPSDAGQHAIDALSAAWGDGPAPTEQPRTPARSQFPETRAG